MSDYFKNNGYDIEITVGVMYLTTSLKTWENGLCDTLDINITENQARTASFSFIPPHQTIYLDNYVGQPVSIVLRNRNGDWLQVFTGQVDTPSVEFSTGKITLRCTDNRNNRVIQLDPSVIATVGSYSEEVQGRISDQADELEKRLQTTPYSFDFDNYGDWHFTPWLSKANPDYTFYPADFDRNIAPEIDGIDSSKAINTYNITINYTYSRLHQQTASFDWNGYGEFSEWWHTLGRPTFPAIASIESAAKSSDWKIVQGVNYTPVWEAGSYSGIVWQPNEVQTTMRVRMRNNGYLKTIVASGDPPINKEVFVTVGEPPKLVPDIRPVLDKKGQPIYEVASTTVIDRSSMLCRSASWISAIRFSQNITEQYSIKMVAPQAVALSDTISGSLKVDITDNYDVSQWEKTDQVTFSTQPFYVNKKQKYGNVLSAINVALNKTRRDLLNLYRKVTVTLAFKESHLHPELDLHYTIECSVDNVVRGESKRIKVKAKIFSINHTIDFSTTVARTTVTVKLSRSKGTTASDVWQVPIPVEDPSYIGSTQNIVLETHLGQDAENTQGSDQWTGWHGNKYPSIGGGLLGNRTQFPESFIVNYPAIKEELRQLKIYTSESAFNVFIPNEFLEYES